MINSLYAECSLVFFLCKLENQNKWPLSNYTGTQNQIFTMKRKAAGWNNVFITRVILVLIIFTQYFYMLAAEPRPQFELPKEDLSMDDQHSMESSGPKLAHKQIQKSSDNLRYKILLGVAVFFMASLASYMVFANVGSSAQEGKLNQQAGKIIQNAQSSKGKNSNSGSSSSKASKANEKPSTSSKPASKNVISSNRKTGGSTGGGDGNENNDGDKNKKILDESKRSSTGKSTKEDGKSTEDDRDSESFDIDEEIPDNGYIWPNNRDQGPIPLIGSKRN